MDKFVEEAKKYNIPESAIENMVKRDIEYKNDIYRKLHAMKVRQTSSLIIGSAILLVMSIILYQVIDTTRHLDMLIKALLYLTRMG